MNDSAKKLYENDIVKMTYLAIIYTYLIERYTHIN